VLTLFCDTDVGLRIGDPVGRDAALSCGAVLEGMVLALSAVGHGADVALTGAQTHVGQGLVAVAHVTPSDGPEDGLHTQLEQRFTWRGAFRDTPANLFGWTRADTRLVLDVPNRAWLAERADRASHQIMQDKAFRKELLAWMRMSDKHPRAGLDGMDAAALQMRRRDALIAPFALTKAWGVLQLLGITKTLTAEAGVTLTAPVIALFHRDLSENPIASGRAYLRLCLEAASLGFAGWPMAALSDHPDTRAEVCTRFNIPGDRRLVQAIRFGAPTGKAAPRARRPLGEVIR